jgi:hypothetical protein
MCYVLWRMQVGLAAAVVAATYLLFRVRAAEVGRWVGAALLSLTANCAAPVLGILH